MPGRPKDHVPKKPVRKAKPRTTKAKKPAVKKPVGRPPIFHARTHVPWARDLSWLGRNNREMMESFKISEDTFYAWLRDEPEFAEAVEEGRDRASAGVIRSLYGRAMGWQQPAEKIMVVDKVAVAVPYIQHFPPDTGAATFWLKNRAGWSDRIDARVDFNATVRRALLELGDD